MSDSEGERKGNKLRVSRKNYNWFPVENKIKKNLIDNENKIKTPLKKEKCIESK